MRVKPKVIEVIKAILGDLVRLDREPVYYGAGYYKVIKAIIGNLVRLEDSVEPESSVTRGRFVTEATLEGNEVGGDSVEPESSVTRGRFGLVKLYVFAG